MKIIQSNLNKCPSTNNLKSKALKEIDSRKKYQILETQTSRNVTNPIILKAPKSPKKVQRTLIKESGEYFRNVSCFQPQLIILSKDLIIADELDDCRRFKIDLFQGPLNRNYREVDPNFLVSWLLGASLLACVICMLL